MQIGMIDRTPRGRVATPRAYQYFGRETPQTPAASFLVLRTGIFFLDRHRTNHSAEYRRLQDVRLRAFTRSSVCVRLDYAREVSSTTPNGQACRTLEWRTRRGFSQWTAQPRSHRRLITRRDNPSRAQLVSMWTRHSSPARNRVYWWMAVLDWPALAKSTPCSDGHQQ